MTRPPPEGSPLTPQVISAWLGLQVEGTRTHASITGVSGLSSAGASELSFARSARFFPLVSESGAGAVLVPQSYDGPLPPDGCLLRSDEPEVDFARVADHLAPSHSAALHAPDRAYVAPGASVHPSARLAPFAFVGAGARLEAGVVLGVGAHVHAGATVGEATRLMDHVVIGEGCAVGRRCEVNAGTVIGGPGFGFVRDRAGALWPMPQRGVVIIGDDVRIGAACAIDRAADAAAVTRIGRGTKIDNLVQIGHGVQVGPDCVIVAQSGVAGSSTLQRGVTMAAQAGVAGHLTIGAGSRIHARSGVITDLEPGADVAGAPSTSRGSFLRSVIGIRELDDLRKRVRALEQRLKGLKP